MSRIPSAWLNGLIGVLIFSGSLPATRLALRGFEPLFLSFSRAAIAGVVGAIALWLSRQERPPLSDLPSLVVVALGVVVGFPFLTAFALEYITASRGLIYTALIPIATAVFAVLRAKEYPKLRFWLFSFTASILVMLFAFTTGNIEGSLKGDPIMFVAVILCGLGYAEGGYLSRRLGGWQVISWALLISLPIMFPLAVFLYPKNFINIDATSILALGYVSIFSMLVGFIFWYKGLAEGGIASVGQLQFLQPFFGLAISSLMLSEIFSINQLLIMFLVVICVFFARKAA